MLPHIIFITGTDTGVGKTVLTSLLLLHLRRMGAHSIGVKPFCSGGRDDAQLLYSVQDGDFSLDEINPFSYPQPVTPMVAARLCRRRSRIVKAVRYLQNREKQLLTLSHTTKEFETLESADKGVNPSIAPREPMLLVEGAGGLLSPLGENFDLLTLIQKMMRSKNGKRRKVSVIVAAANRLGTLNHTLLTVRRLQDARVENISVVITDVVPPEQATPDAKSNPKVLTELLRDAPIFHLPYLGAKAVKARRLYEISKAQRPLLSTIFSSLLR